MLENVWEKATQTCDDCLNKLPQMRNPAMRHCEMAERKGTKRSKRGVPKNETWCLQAAEAASSAAKLMQKLV